MEARAADEYAHEKIYRAREILFQHERVIRFNGSDIKDVFGAVSKEDYFDSIWNDIEEAETEIMDNPIYIILNLCRVLAYKKEELILSKQEGGKWGIRNIPEKYQTLIVQALDEYLSDKSTEWDEKNAHEYAAYMITQIRN